MMTIMISIRITIITIVLIANIITIFYYYTTFFSMFYINTITTIITTIITSIVMRGISMQNTFLNTGCPDVNLLIKVDVVDSSSTRIDADLSFSGQAIFTNFKIVCARSLRARGIGVVWYFFFLMFRLFAFL